MNKITITAAALLAVLSIASTSCGSARKAAQQQAETKEEVLGSKLEKPLDGPEYRTDSEFWRAVSNAISPDLALSKEIAATAAREELAQSLEAYVQYLNERYATNSANNGEAESLSDFKRLSRTAAKQTLLNSTIKAEETFVKDGQYNTFVCVEISRAEYRQRLEELYQKEADAAAKMTREEFTKLFEEVMDEQ